MIESAVTRKLTFALSNVAQKGVNLEPFCCLLNEPLRRRAFRVSAFSWRSNIVRPSWFGGEGRVFDVSGYQQRLSGAGYRDGGVSYVRLLIADVICWRKIEEATVLCDVY